MKILKILILGSNGFFGKSIKNLFKNEKYDFFYLERKDVDFLEKNQLNNKFQEIMPDIVIHCCGIIGSSESNKEVDQLYILNTNIILNVNIFECCNNTKSVKKLILFSTYRCFPQNIHEFYNEDSLSFINLLVDQQNNGYLISKKIMHIQMEVLKKTNPSMQIICLIIPNIFGYYDHFTKNGRIVPSIISKINEEKQEKQKEKEENIYIHSHHKTQVNIIYMNDIIKLLSICVERNDIHGNIIVFDYKSIVTLEELANKIKILLNSNKTIIFDSHKSLEQSNIMKPDTSKFNKLFSDFTFSKIDDSLKETIDFYLSTS